MRRVMLFSVAGLAALALAGHVSAATIESGPDGPLQKIKPSTVAEPKVSEGKVSLEISGMT